MKIQALVATMLSSAVLAVQNEQGWSYEQALISHQLNKAAYCWYATYLTHQWNDPETANFAVTKVLYNAKKEVEVFVGILPSDQAIYVTFRGSD